MNYCAYCNRDLGVLSVSIFTNKSPRYCDRFCKRSKKNNKSIIYRTYGSQHIIIGRICGVCKKQKSKGAYHSSERYRHGMNSQCKDCRGLERKRNIDKYLKRESNYRRKMRQSVLNHYGRKCSCCAQDTEQFLALDHINNNGSEHRKIIRGGSTDMYRWVVKNGFPKDFQILCHNCNVAKGTYGKCPHTEHGV